MIKSISRAVKIFMIVIAISLAATTKVAAQDDVDVKQLAKMITDKIKTEVGLTDAQYKSALGINTKFLENVSKLKKSNPNDPKIKQQAKVVAEKWQKELKAILTPQQIKKMDALKSKA